MGNPIHKILHGGVIAAILYTVGGLMAVIYAVKDIANVSTIDMPVDYLRPGKGKAFIAIAKIKRRGVPRTTIMDAELDPSHRDGPAVNVSSTAAPR